MSAASDDTRSSIPFLSLAAAIAAISVAGAGFGHSLPLFSFLLDSYGASDVTIGLNTGVAAIASLVAAPFFPRLVARIGLKAFLILSLTIMVLPYGLVHLAGDRIWLWYPLRFLFAFGASGLFAGSEIWINGVAPDRIRGKVIGLYGTCLALGFALGPLLLDATGYEGFTPFGVGMAVFSLAMIPIVLARAPAVDPGSPGNIFEPIGRAPIIFGAAAMFAGVESAMLIFLPILSLEIGHGVSVGAQTLTVYGFGILAAQMPVGWLADRVPPRSVMVGCATTGAALAALIPLVQGSVASLYAVLFIWGGAVGGIYTAGLVVLGNRFKGKTLAAANTGFIFAYAAGSVIGPIAAGAIRTGLGANGLAIALTLTLAAYAWAARWSSSARA